MLTKKITVVLLALTMMAPMSAMAWRGHHRAGNTHRVIVRALAARTLHPPRVYRAPLVTYAQSPLPMVYSGASADYDVPKLPAAAAGRIPDNTQAMGNAMPPGGYGYSGVPPGQIDPVPVTVDELQSQAAQNAMPQAMLAPAQSVPAVAPAGQGAGANLVPQAAEHSPLIMPSSQVSMVQADNLSSAAAVPLKSALPPLPNGALQAAKPDFHVVAQTAPPGNGQSAYKVKYDEECKCYH